MKRILPILALLLLTGCVTTEFTMGTVHIKRSSFLSKMEIKELSVSTNGAAILKGYRGTGDADLVSAAAEGAAAGAVAAGK